MPTKSTLLAALVLGATAAGATETNLWIRDAAISPTGDRIAFTYKGDIFTVPVVGGTATRLTSQSTYETAPVWSPDGKTIAFASDAYGNFDVFAVAADGSDAAWKRLTFNSANETPEAFTPDGKSVLFSAAIQDPASSCQYPSGRLSEVYSVPLNGGAPVQFLATPAQRISWAADGHSMVYQDVKGFEDIWRKHHTSSVTRDIWRYTPGTGRHQKLVDAAGEDLDPVLAGDTLFFLSERAPQTSLNVYMAPAGNPAQAVAVTNFRRHPVRFLSRAADGTLAFMQNGDIYTLRSGGRPAKVNVNINADYPDQTESISATRGARGAVVSPNGKNVAFIYRGDVYVTATDYSTTKQVTDTPEAESHLSWGNDSTLYFTSERDGHYNIYRATPGRRGSENEFVHATVIDTERMFPADSHERTVPRVSPDGKQLAFILDRNKLAVMDLERRLHLSAPQRQLPLPLEPRQQMDCPGDNRRPRPVHRRRHSQSSRRQHNQHHPQRIFRFRATLDSRRRGYNLHFRTIRHAQPRLVGFADRRDDCIPQPGRLRQVQARRRGT